jgi:predicted CXXCH cytochrome family protein
MGKLKVGFAVLLALFMVSIFAAAASAEEPFVPTPSNPAPGINVGTVQNDGTYGAHRTHGNFQNNTNSCGNCHSTHQGDSATLLKFESAEYDMCLSCHDGTLGFYNVKQASGAGTFGNFEENSHESLSMHNVQGQTRIDAAPGSLTENGDALACSSCHNPHGSTNDRLLKTTVNGQTYASKPIDLELDVIKDLNGLKIYKSNGTAFDKDYPADSPQNVYSAFCSTCHESYLAHSGTKTANGHYSHTTDIGKAGRNCASCHYAHGTDITMLKDTAGKTIGDYMKPVAQGGKGWSEDVAKDYMRDISEGGSALKKYTNMAVCWACHQTTHRLDTPAVEGGNYQGKPTK